MDRGFFCIYPVFSSKQATKGRYCEETGYCGTIFSYIPRSPGIVIKSAVPRRVCQYGDRTRGTFWVPGHRGLYARRGFGYRGGATQCGFAHRGTIRTARLLTSDYQTTNAVRLKEPGHRASGAARLCAPGHQATNAVRLCMPGHQTTNATRLGEPGHRASGAARLCVPGHHTHGAALHTWAPYARRGFGHLGTGHLVRRDFAYLSTIHAARLCAPGHRATGATHGRPAQTFGPMTRLHT